MEIKQLDQNLINMANSNSMSGTRGDVSVASYQSYINEILNWEIPDAKKQKILDLTYKKYSKILEYEAQHVSWIVAGPAKYNSKRLDKSEQILQTTHDFCKWFEDLKEQANNTKEKTKEETVNLAIQSINRLMDLHLNPTTDIMKLAYIDNKKFIELYEKYQPIFKWRKNSNIFKLYAQSLNGEIQEIKKEIIYEDENLTAYIEGNRAYIRFPMKVQRQLIVALKSRKWWWNSHKQAWSTYPDRVDKEWISSISEKYSKYL